MVSTGRRLALLGLVGAVAACGGGGSSSSGPPPLTGSATSYVVRLDDIPVAGFTVVSPPTVIDAKQAAEGDAGRMQGLRDAGLVEAATAHYFRQVQVLRTSTGPIDVISTVLRCGDADGGHRVFGLEAAHEDGISGATPLSTGPIADEAHADLQTATADDGTPVAQTTLLWRARNLVSVVVVRERLAGSPLADAVLVARAAVARQGNPTPAASGA